ncbi:hypothetical protein EPD60_00925 [Flaviaesturariibacter flavus]|uniref:Trypsin-like serine protease n=1 Tax=Flaviaesturariibacter flavus TaxID=2502780 RepID=A0A4R1BNC7_9BACT|nr:hypothetical protein [Flaviaesturariibacter flavus]TCJ19009.1 hypothetical protein EPD60_00925 [Flaviaesturariibacter flavus]
MPNRKRKHLRRLRRQRKPRLSSAVIARLALEQHGAALRARFSQIAAISDAAVPGTGAAQHVLAIYLHHSDCARIPYALPVRLPGGGLTAIATELVPGVGAGTVHICQQDEICCSTDNPGSVGCVVRDAYGEHKVATAGHVFSSGSLRSYNGELAPTETHPALVNGQAIGNWFFQLIDWKTDLALGDIDNYIPGETLLTFPGHYTVSDADVGRTRVRVVSGRWSPPVRDAWILDHNTAWEVAYRDGTATRNNIIVIGSAPNRADATTVSRGGDSGGCVYEPVSGRLVGLILGGNNRFTWVLPIGEVLQRFNYELA